MEITVLDFGTFVLMGGMAVTGSLRGFTQEVLSIFAWIMAVIAVRILHAPITDLLTVWVNSAGGASIVAFVLLFVGTFIVFKLIARRIGEALRSSVIGPIDRVLGLGFGALKGLIVATVLFLGFSLVYNFMYGSDAPRPAWMAQARSYPLLQASANAMTQIMNERGRVPLWSDD